MTSIITRDMAEKLKRQREGIEKIRVAHKVSINNVYTDFNDNTYGNKRLKELIKYFYTRRIIMPCGRKQKPHVHKFEMQPTTITFDPDNCKINLNNTNK